MFKNILIPFDGLRTTIPTVKYGIQFAKCFNSKIYFLYIINEKALNSTKAGLRKSISETKKYCLERTRGLFDIVLDQSKEMNFDNFEIIIEFAESVDGGIKDFIFRKKIDFCIVTQSPYAHSELVGDLAKKISKKVSIPILFIRTETECKKDMKILVPVDEKEKNKKSIDFGIGIAKILSGTLIFYHTTWRKNNLLEEDLEKHCEECVIENLKTAKANSEKNKIKFEKIIEIEPTIEGGIIKCAVKKGVDLIIMNQSGSVLGGKADLVLNNSMYPLLLLP